MASTIIARAIFSQRRQQVAAAGATASSADLGVIPMELLAQFNASHFFLAGLLATSAIILSQTRRRWQRCLAAKAHKPVDAGKSCQAAASKLRPAEVQQWEVHVHDLARETLARIDSKMAALAHLMRAANQESLRLEAAIARASEAGMLPAGSRSDAAELAPANQAQVLRQSVLQHDAYSPAHCDIPKPHTRLSHAEIHALADAGVAPRQIAERTGTPEGEVQLILGLRSQASSTSGNQPPPNAGRKWIWLPGSTLASNPREVTVPSMETARPG